MALTVNVVDSALRLKFETGVDIDGNSIQKTRSYNNIKTDALDQDIYDSAQIISNLQEHTLLSVGKVVESELIETL
jgi:hypothetical protein